MASGSERALRIESRRAKVAAMVLRGITNQFELAERVGMGREGRSTISRDLAVIREQWKQSAVRDLDEAKGKLLDQLELAMQELWAAWDRSKQPRESTRTRRRTASGDRGAGQADEAEVRKEPRDGNPKFMELIHRNLAQQAEILGLYAPKKVQHGQDPDAEPIQMRLQGGLTVEEFRELPVEEKVRQLQARFEAASRPSQN